MRPAKVALLIVGCLMVLLGLLWIGQGTGYVRYPQASFMIDQSPWAWRGAALAVVGALVLILSRRA